MALFLFFGRWDYAERVHIHIRIWVDAKNTFFFFFSKIENWKLKIWIELRSSMWGGGEWWEFIELSDIERCLRMTPKWPCNSIWIGFTNKTQAESEGESERKREKTYINIEMVCSGHWLKGAMQCTRTNCIAHEMVNRKWKYWTTPVRPQTRTHTPNTRTKSQTKMVNKQVSLTLFVIESSHWNCCHHIHIYRWLALPFSVFCARANWRAIYAHKLALIVNRKTSQLSDFMAQTRGRTDTWS